MDTFTASYKRRSPPPAATATLSTPTLGPLTPRGLGGSVSPRGSPPSSSPVPFQDRSHTVQASATATATPIGLQSRSTKPKTGGGNWTPPALPLSGATVWSATNGVNGANGDSSGLDDHLDGRYEHSGTKGYTGYGHGAYKDESGPVVFVPAYGKAVMSDSERRSAESSKMGSTISLPGSSRMTSVGSGSGGPVQGPYAYSTTLRRQVSLETFPTNLQSGSSGRRASSRGPRGSFGSPRKRPTGEYPSLDEEDDVGTVPDSFIGRLVNMGRRVWTGKSRKYESVGLEEDVALGGNVTETPSSIYAYKSINVSTSSCSLLIHGILESNSIMDASVLPRRSTVFKLIILAANRP